MEQLIHEIVKELKEKISDRYKLHCVKGEGILYFKKVRLKHKFRDIMKLLMSLNGKFAKI